MQKCPWYLNSLNLEVNLQLASIWCSKKTKGQEAKDCGYGGMSLVQGCGQSLEQPEASVGVEQ